VQTPPKQTGAAILVSRGMKVLQAAPAAYPYRSADKWEGSMQRSTKLLLLATLLLVAMGVTVWLVWFPPWAPLPSPDDAVQSVKTQSDALRFARASDIPAAGKADRMVIKITILTLPIEKPKFPEGRSFTIADHAAIQSLVETLIVKETPETGGMNYATVTFYQGSKEIRSIWLFANGEWGFIRPGPGSSHSTGVSGDLVRKVKQLIPANKADD
jgi:hypothetical protein